MSRRGTRLLAWLVAPALILILAAWNAASTPVAAQSATPAAIAPETGATPEATAGTPGTPTPTRTPTLTPTPTATLTELQAQIVLAQAFLDGKDYESATDLFADILAHSRGNPEALAGLQEALDGQTAEMATMMAPLPTEAPTVVPEIVVPTLVETTRLKLLDIGGTALAALAVVVLLYFAGALLRWLLGTLREVWYMRILPLLNRPVVLPGLLLGEFDNSAGAGAEGAARVVPLAIIEKLIAWNRLVQDQQVPVQMAPELELGPMAWMKVLWSWILPPARLPRHRNPAEWFGRCVPACRTAHRPEAQQRRWQRDLRATLPIRRGGFQADGGRSSEVAGQAGRHGGRQSRGRSQTFRG